jgi:hypothetical protein
MGYSSMLVIQPFYKIRKRHSFCAQQHPKNWKAQKNFNKMNLFHYVSWKNPFYWMNVGDLCNSEGRSLRPYGILYITTYSLRFNCKQFVKWTHDILTGTKGSKLEFVECVEFLLRSQSIHHCHQDANYFLWFCI